MLETLYARHFKNCSYIRLNVSQKDTIVTEESRNLVRRFVEGDFELYRMAQENLDSLIEKYIPEQGAWRDRLDNFQ